MVVAVAEMLNPARVVVPVLDIEKGVNVVVVANVTGEPVAI